MTLNDIKSDLNTEDGLTYFAGEGQPADEVFAVKLGADYICALDDGRCVAWGADRHNEDRQVVVYNSETDFDGIN